MSKFKPVRPKKKAGPSQSLQAVPCLVLVIGIMVLLMLLFYFVLKGSHAS